MSILSKIKNETLILLIIMLAASALRLVNLTKTPPGLNQDEAANAWSAYCLLKTGKDYYYRTSWPLFYVRNVGGNSSTLYVYLMIPFQAIGGLNVYTTRLPAALGGILAVWLMYYVGRRLFGPAAGLAAAALLAIDPWHIQHSRNGLESSISPLCSIAPLALLLWAGLLAGDKNDDDKTASPRPIAAILAGLLTGIGCYGHWEIRLFVPAFLFLLVLLTLPSWWRVVKTLKGAATAALFLLGFAVTWGALIWQHIFHPEGVSRHALFQKEWIGSVPISAAIKSIADRYIQHFGPNFLFIEHDPNPYFSPPTIGHFYWYMALLFLAGAIWLLWRFKSASARILIAFVLTYPVGDCLVWGGGLSILRSAPGVCALVLLAAVGAVYPVGWLWRKNHKVAITVIVIFSIAAAGMNLKYLYYFYGKYSRQLDIYQYFHTDLVEACRWLKPRFDDFDAIYVTTDRLNMPYVVTTVALDYDPKKWFSEPIELIPSPVEVETQSEWDIYLRYGKMHFIYDYAAFSFVKLEKQYPAGKTLLILRPDECGFLIEFEKLERPDEFKLENPDELLIHTIYAPDGSPSLYLYRF